MGFHRSINETIKLIGVKDGDKDRGPSRYQGVIKSLVLAKLTEIEIIEKDIKNSKLVKAISFLLLNRNRENDDTLQYTFWIRGDVWGCVIY
jgi:hypothetical protein